jgi:hypothetical protein
MFQWSMVVLVETSTCRSRGSACGLEGDREERSNKGLVEVLRTSMKTCGVCPRRPAAAAHCSVLERASGVSSSAEGTSSFGKAGALTCTGWKGAQAIGSRALTRPRAGRSGEVSEGSNRRSRLQPRKLRRSSPQPERASAKAGSRSARSRRRAVKHGAVGGRMTARWSGAVLGRNGGNAAFPRGRSRCRKVGGFPTAFRRAVSRGDVCRGCS